MKEIEIFWKDIEEKYPIGYKLWSDYIDKENKRAWIHVTHIGIIGHVFEFFDSNKLYINIFIEQNLIWRWTIRNHKFDCLASQSFNLFTRKDAEQIAITKAFELLNEKK